MINQKDQKGLTRKFFRRRYGVRLEFFVLFCAKSLYTQTLKKFTEICIKLYSKDFYYTPLRRSVIIKSIKYLAQPKINCVINQGQFK